MATKTTNLGLTKPAGTDQYDINVFNGNFDIIDILGTSKLSVPTGTSSQVLNGQGVPITPTATPINGSALPFTSGGAYNLLSTIPTGGVRPATFVIGHKNSGHTAADVDYLCDGTDDQVEINAAIQALPSGGGRIVIREGTYNITGTIAVNKANVTIEGMGGSATRLERRYNESVEGGLIHCTKHNITIQKLYIAGNSGTYTTPVQRLNWCIYLTANVTNALDIIQDNICTDSYGGGIYVACRGAKVTKNRCDYHQGFGIHVANAENLVTGNSCSANGTGIYVTSPWCTISQNTCTSNSDRGIHTSSDANKIQGNHCVGNKYGISLLGLCTYNIVSGNSCDSNNEYGIQINGGMLYSISDNTCSNNKRGIDVIAGFYNGITGNILYNNSSYGIAISESKSNTIANNTCIASETTGIMLGLSDNNAVSGNICNDSGNRGIALGTCFNNAITGNICIDNSGAGIFLALSQRNNVTGNTCIRGTGLSTDYTSTQHTIYLDSTGNNNNLISSNNIMGKNYTTGGGSSNTFVNNKYN